MDNRSEDAHNLTNRPGGDEAPQDRAIPGPNDPSSEGESKKPSIGSKSTSDPSPHNPDESTDQRSPGRLLDRIPGERVGIIVAMLALLVGLGTWLLPHPYSALCYLMGNRAFDCNDIPNAYLGTWKGRVEMVKSPIFSIPGPGSGTDSVTIRRAKMGHRAAEQKPVYWRDDAGQKVGCSHTWQLADVQKDLIELKTTDAHAVTSDTTNEHTGCLNNLTMDVRLATHDTIEITALAGESNSPFAPPPGVAVFKGTLHRVTTG